MADPGNNYVKLILSGPDGQIETPWAEHVSDNLFRLDNMPFYAYGVSADDIVEARPTEHEGVVQFIRVHEPSGNRTLRIAFEDGRSTADADAQSLLQAILDSGSAYEGATPTYVVLTIPPSTDLGLVTGLLDRAGLRWEYANPTHEQLHGSA